MRGCGLGHGVRVRTVVEPVSSTSSGSWGAVPRALTNFRCVYCLESVCIPTTSLADTPSHPSISPPTSLADTPSHASFFEACFSILSLGTVGFRYYGRRTRIATFALDDDFRAVHRLATPSTLAHTKNPTDNAATATRRPSHAAVARASGLSVFKVRYDARR